MAVKDILKKNEKLIHLYEDCSSLAVFMKINLECLFQRFTMSGQEKGLIREIKNSHPGERCFIIGNGTSLKIEDLEKLGGEKCFAVNSMFRAYSSTAWRPDYYMVVDDNFFNNTGDESYKNDTYEAYFLGTAHKKDIPNAIRVNVNSGNKFLIGTCWNRVAPKLFPVGRCSYDISKVVYGGQTVIYPTIQIAMYMGFKDIYLLGVDCCYSTNNEHASFIQNTEHEKISQNKADDMSRKMVLQFRELSKRLPEDVHIYNLSPIGNLDAFPRKNLDDVLNERNQ